MVWPNRVWVRSRVAVAPYPRESRYSLMMCSAFRLVPAAPVDAIQYSAPGGRPEQADRIVSMHDPDAAAIPARQRALSRPAAADAHLRGHVPEARPRPAGRAGAAALRRDRDPRGPRDRRGRRLGAV